MKKLLAFLIAATFASLSVAADKPAPKGPAKKVVKKHKKAEGHVVPEAPKAAPKAPAKKK